MKDLFDAGILGVIEGLTEFIPVSSTGHLILAETILRRPDAAASVFDVFIQVGAVMAVLWVRRARIVRMLAGLPSDRQEQGMALKIVVAFLPAALLGMVLHGFIKAVLFSPWVVGASLIGGGVFMLFAERIAPAEKTPSMESMPLKTALGIGLCQMLALIPGISRAGASIVGARMLGVERRTATEFSFFLAIPTIFGAAAYDLYKNIDLLSRDDLPLFLTGTVTAFVAALLVVNWLIDFVGRHGFVPFGWYRIVAGGAVLALLFSGVL